MIKPKTIVKHNPRNPLLAGKLAAPVEVIADGDMVTDPVANMLDELRSVTGADTAVFEDLADWMAGRQGVAEGRRRKSKTSAPVSAAKARRARMELACVEARLGAATVAARAVRVAQEGTTRALTVEDRRVAVQLVQLLAEQLF